MSRLVVCLFLLVACERARATPEDCTHILDRLVAVELEERGYHDPVLVERQTQAARATFGPRLRACVGQRLRKDALACVDQARTTEQIVHKCLR